MDYLCECNSSLCEEKISLTPTVAEAIFLAPDQDKAVDHRGELPKWP